MVVNHAAENGDPYLITAFAWPAVTVSLTSLAVCLASAVSVDNESIMTRLDYNNVLVYCHVRADNNFRLSIKVGFVSIYIYFLVWKQL